MSYVRVQTSLLKRRRERTPSRSYMEDLLGKQRQRCTLLLLGGDHMETYSVTEASLGAGKRWCAGTRVGGCGAQHLKEMLALQDVTERVRLLVVVHCPLHQVIQLFSKVRRKRLESVWVTWILFPSSSEDLTQLQSSLNDGLQVLAVVPANEGTLLYQSTVGVNGSISFSNIGEWKKRKCHQHRTVVEKNQGAIQTPDAERHLFESTSRRGCGGGQELTRGTGALEEPYLELVLQAPPFPTLRDLRQQDLQGRTLQVSVLNNWPFFGVTHDEGGNLVPESGIDVSVVSTLGKIMNFSIQVVTPSDGEWGKKLPNGSWSGIIGMVTRREVNFAINEITSTEERGAALELTRPYYLESSTLLSRAPALTGRALAVFSPFTATVWLLLTLSIVLAGPAFCLMTSIQKQLRLRTEIRQLSFFDSCFNVFKVFFMQTDSSVPSTAALRLIAIFWYLFSFKFLILYSGKLTAVFASPTYERPIDSLSDLLMDARSEGVLPITLKGSSIHALFEKSKSGVYHDIYQFFTDESYALSRDDGVQKVLESGGVLIESTLALEIRAAQRGRRLFHIGREFFFPQAYSIACVTGSTISVAFDFWLECMVEGGLINQWKKEQLEKLKSDSSVDHQTSISPLELGHLQGAFFLYALGCGAAVIALLGECLLFKRASARN